MSDAAAWQPLAQTFTGAAFRAHHPRWAFDPESGEGARRRGGRFNPPGMAALYLSLSMEGAWAEAQQGLPAKAQPLTLCQYEVDCADVLDLRDTRVRDALGTSAEALACAWYAIAYLDRREPPSWALVRRLAGAGAAGLLVPSYAAHAPTGASNLVLWKWSRRRPYRVRVVDDEGRLARLGEAARLR